MGKQWDPDPESIPDDTPIAQEVETCSWCRILMLGVTEPLKASDGRLVHSEVCQKEMNEYLALPPEARAKREVKQDDDSKSERPSSGLWRPSH